MSTYLHRRLGLAALCSPEDLSGVPPVHPTVHKHWSWAEVRWQGLYHSQGTGAGQAVTLGGGGDTVGSLPCFIAPKPVHSPWAACPCPECPEHSPCCRLCCHQPSERWPVRWEPCWEGLLGVLLLQLVGDGGGPSYLSSSPLSVSSTFCRLLPLSRANSLNSEPSTRRLSPSCPSGTARHSSPSLLLKRWPPLSRPMRLR